MTSPLVEQYDKADPPYSEFRSGNKGTDLSMDMIRLVVKVTAKYAKCTNNNLWELETV